MWKGAGRIIVNGIAKTDVRKMKRRRIYKHRQLTLDMFRRRTERQQIVQMPHKRQKVIEQALPFEDMDFTLKKKRCPYCGKVLPFNMFNLSRKAKDGRQPYCRACQRKYRDEHPDVQYKYKHNNIGTLRIRW